MNHFGLTRWRGHWPGRATAWPCQGLYRLWCLGGCGSGGWGHWGIFLEGPGFGCTNSSGSGRLCKVEAPGCPDCNRLGMPLIPKEISSPVLRSYLQVACQCGRRSRTMLTGLSPVFKKFWCLVQIVVRVMARGASWQISKRFQALFDLTIFSRLLAFVTFPKCYSLGLLYALLITTVGLVDSFAWRNVGAAASCLSMPVGLTDFHRRISQLKMPMPYMESRCL